MNEVAKSPICLDIVNVLMSLILSQRWCMKMRQPVAPQNDAIFLFFLTICSVLLLNTNCMDSVSITLILVAYIHPDADSKDKLRVYAYL